LHRRYRCAAFLPLLLHEPGVAQDLQVLRHRRPADRQPARDLADRLRPADDTLEDRAPRRIGEGGQ